MYAIFKTGAKQYKVSSGDKIKVERLDVKPGEEITFKPILVSNENKIDFNEDGKWVIKCKAIAEGKHKKILVFHKKRRKQYKKLKGHRQLFTLVEINSIQKD
ncbi:MAG: 50S ribosomal protein L21 [Thermoanaerobaculaceae bacterium]|nr:50S ribosomal protein L21 [Thermoanaerobaculaceae bacterium]